MAKSATPRQQDALIIAMGCIVPLAFLWLRTALSDLPLEAVYEFDKYVFGAHALLDYGRLYIPAEVTGGYPKLSDRLPGYPAFLGAVFALFGRDNFLAVVLVQILLSGLTVLGIARMAQLVDQRWLWPAAVLASLWPNLSFRAATVTPGVFFTVWLVWGAYFCLAATSSRHPARCMLLASLCLGVAYATRPALLLLPVFLLPVLIYLFRQKAALRTSRALLLALMPVVFMLLTTVPQYVFTYHHFGVAVQQTQTGKHLLLWAYPCLSQPLGCGERNSEAVVYAQAELEARLASLPEDVRSNPVRLDRIRADLGAELIMELPPLQFLTAATGAAVKLLVHPFWSDAFHFLEVRPVFFGEVQGDSFGERMTTYLAALVGSPVMVVWTLGFILVLAGRGVQVFGCVTALFDPRYRPYLLFCLAFLLPLLMTGLGNGNIRLRAPMEPWFIMFTLFAFYAHRARGPGKAT